MLNPDYRDMLSLLLEKKVEFLIVGAYALAAHGLPRATGDIDLFIKPDQVNAKRVLEALAAFGAPLSGITAADFETSGTVFQIGVAPRRIDILTDIDGVSFAEAWSGREIVPTDGLLLPFISRALLLKNKLATGRAKDALDAEALQNG